MIFRNSSLAVAGALAVFVAAPTWTVRDLRAVLLRRRK
jgi:hypothetical protein